MNFGQLIEYNLKNIFLEKSYTKRGRETNQNCAYLWINILKFYTLFLLFAKLRPIESDWNHVADHLPLPQIKFF